MALLLRMGGVAARVATGFTPGGYSAHQKQWIVRDTDAHAWDEVWFDGYGWVTIDPTPDASPARSQIAALTLPKSEQNNAAAQTTKNAEGGASANKSSVRPDLAKGTAGSTDT